MPLLSILQDMENTGILVDRAYLSKLSVEFSAEMAGIEKRIYSIPARNLIRILQNNWLFNCLKNWGLSARKRQKRTGLPTKRF